MGLFDKIGGGGAPGAAGKKPGGYDFVEVPTAGGQVKRWSKSEFEARPLAERIGVLVEGTARFIRGGEVVPSREALKSDY
jgi:hypothetical protein